MSESDKESFWFLIGGAMVATVVLVLISALYFGSQNGAERDQQFRLACIEAGGSFVPYGTCVNPRIKVTR